MICPICTAPLHELDLDLQHVHHCVMCGVSIFEDGGIDRITSATAAFLKENRIENRVPTQQEPAVKLCPADQAPLQARINRDSIPTHVHLLTCPTCHRIVAKPQDLIDFKHAQEAKVNYIKAWRLPMPQLRSVFAIVVMAMMSVFGYLTFSTLNNQALLRTQAAQVVQNVQVQTTGRLVILSFQTEQPVRTSLIILEPAGIDTIPVSGRANTLHTTSFSRPLGATILKYRIELIDTHGNTVVSDLQTAALE